jgi:aminoglycoside phosphotransferase (APT) family kinase protein/2-polyprenyl-3-methyl-5-hydroxy-6-metoxy-1,4-benzoquinol methylase
VEVSILSMSFKVDAVKIKEYFHHMVNEENALIPRRAANIRIFNLSKISGTVNSVYSFSLVYSYENRNVKSDLILKLYDNTEQYKRICRKEYLIMKKLNDANFPVPHVYFMEKDERILGGPFIIMEKVEGKSVYSLKRSSKRKIYDVIKGFAKTLVLLHELKLDDIDANVLAKPKDEYAYARKSALVKDELGYAENWNYGWVTDWLKTNAKKCPCYKYSLLKFDLNLKNFIITGEGKIFFLDWEWAEIGDALRDVGCAYHEISHTFGARAASLFLKHYIRYSKRKIDYNRLRFYIVSSGLKLALYFRCLSTKKLGTWYLIKLFGRKYIPLFPFIRYHFKRRRIRLENFLKSEVLDYEKAMFGTLGGKILSSMEIQDVLKLLNAVPSDLVLDVGTGSGRIAREIVAKANARVVGIDNRQAITSAKQNRGNLSNYELVVADGQHLPFRDSSFDAVICIRTLKYFQDYVRGIAEMTRVLKPAESLIIDLSSVFGYEAILRHVTHSLSARDHHVFNFYKMKNLLKRQKLIVAKSLPLQKIPHKVWNISCNSTVLRLLVVAEEILKKTTPSIFSRSILLKCAKVP